MQKKCFPVVFLIIIIIYLSSGCGGNNTNNPLIISTPALTPVIQPVQTSTPAPHILSSLTEIEAKRVTISAQNGGEVEESDMTIDIPGNALQNDSSLEIARVNIQEGTSSNNNGIIEEFKISTGSKGNGTELQKPATVSINADEQSIPLIWDGSKWLPLDYTYDRNKQKIILQLTYLAEDSNEWDEYAGELGIQSGPTAIGISKTKDKMLTLLSSKKHFKMFYNNPQEQAYTESIAATFEEAYDYYTGLGYNKPITSDFQAGTDPNSNYVTAVYIYPYADSNPDPYSYGIAGTGGTLEINKKLVDSITGKSVCYHELFHLVQFSYTEREANYPNWFGEATAVCMEYYASNRPKELFDSNSGEYWDSNVMSETLNSDDAYYRKFLIWSYILKAKGTIVFHNIMKSSFSKYNGEEFNNVCKVKLGKDLITYFNEIAEDYYIMGTFYNKNYFYNFKERSANQPNVYFIGKNSKEPANSSILFSVPCLSTRYVCYSSKNFKGPLKLELSEKSSNCKVKFFYLKEDNHGTYSVTQEEVSDIKTISDFGNDVTGLFILIENTSINSNAKVTVKTISTGNDKNGGK